MKFYLAAGGLLITAASVYGVTDYLNTKNKEAFKTLYKETPVTLKEDIKPQDVKEEDFSRGKLETPPTQEEIKAPAATPNKKTKATTKKAKRTNAEKPKIEMIPMKEEIKAPANIPEITVTPSPPFEKKKLKKKLHVKMYSRGAIREHVPIPADTTKKN